jgi:hypothetical protein
VRRKTSLFLLALTCANTAHGVQANPTAGQKLSQSAGCIQSVMEFLPQSEQIQMQGLNRDFYNRIVPNAFSKIAIKRTLDDLRILVNNLSNDTNKFCETFVNTLNRKGPREWTFNDVAIDENTVPIITEIFTILVDNPSLEKPGLSWILETDALCTATEMPIPATVVDVNNPEQNAQNFIKPKIQSRPELYKTMRVVFGPSTMNESSQESRDRWIQQCKDDGYCFVDRADPPFATAVSSETFSKEKLTQIRARHVYRAEDNLTGQ